MPLFDARGKRQLLLDLGLTKSAKVTAKLQPHQKRVIDRLSNQQGLVVAHGLGSGKTLSSIAAAEALGLPTAVLVPASLQANYQKEIDKHTDAPIPDMTVGSLQRAILRGEKEMGETGLLIIDEAHRIREPSTKGHKVMSKAKAQKRMLLTASPVYNRPSDVAALVNVAAGSKLLPADKSSFEAKYVKMEKVNPGWFAKTFRGIKPGERPVLTNTKELAPVLKKWVDYHENPKGENFAERVNEYIHVPMSEKQQDVYDGLLEAAPKWVQYKVKQGLPPSKQEAQLINSFLTTQRQVSGSIRPFVEGMDPTEAVPHAAKANEAFNRFKSNLKKNDEHKAVIYSNYLEAGLEPYEMLLKKSKIPYGVFTGKIKKKERDQMVRDYNDGKLKALLVSSAGGEGLDLKGTRQIQILDPHWNNEKIEQVIGRGIRYKSHDHLPKDQRKVNVERYLATNRPGFLRRLLDLKDPDQTADQYLTMLSNDKDALNNQLRGLLKTSAPVAAVRTPTHAQLRFSERSNLPMTHLTKLEAEVAKVNKKSIAHLPPEFSVAFKDQSSAVLEKIKTNKGDRLILKTTLSPSMQSRGPLLPHAELMKNAGILAALAGGYKSSQKEKKPKVNTKKLRTAVRNSAGALKKLAKAPPGHDALRDVPALKPFSPTDMSNQRKKIKYRTEAPSSAQRTLGASLGS